MIAKPYYCNAHQEFKPLEGAKSLKFDVVGNHEFYVHKQIGQKGWAVTDSRSGKIVRNANTRADAIQLSKIRLEKIGARKFHKVSEWALKEALDRPRVIALLEEFGKVTGLSPGIYRNLYIERLTGPSFDPVTLDAAMSRYSEYSHDKSCADNIEYMYGKRAREIAGELLNHKKK